MSVQHWYKDPIEVKKHGRILDSWLSYPKLIVQLRPPGEYLIGLFLCYETEEIFRAVWLETSEIHSEYTDDDRYRRKPPKYATRGMYAVQAHDFVRQLG